MSGFLESANTISADVLTRVWTVLWQWTLIAAVASGVILWLRRAQPAVRFWLWNLLLLKLALMPFWIIAIETAAPSEASARPLPVGSVGEANSSKTGMAVGAGTGNPSSRTAITDNRTTTKFPNDTEPQFSSTPLAGISWTTWLGSAWFVLIAGQLLRTLRQRARLRRFLRLVRPADAELESRVARIGAEIGVLETPRVLISRDDCSPFVCGLWRPTLVLPASLPETLSDASFRQVVLHELAHLNRRDLLWCWLAELVRIVFWFHPLVHWINRRIHLERELACDQVAMVHSDGSPGSYAQTLVDVVTHADDSKHTKSQSHSAQLLTLHP